jgi:hypothetical protein
MGNKESLGRGAVQYLSAGTGITHSEMNDGAETCRPVCMSDSLCWCRKLFTRSFADFFRSGSCQPKMEKLPNMAARRCTIFA